MSNHLPMEKKIDSSEIMHDLSGDKPTLFTRKILLILCVVSLFGLGTGFFLAKSTESGSNNIASKLVNKASIQKGETFGSDDTDTYKDNAEGVLKEGGVEGEGQYHLVRPGGESQNVYLTSSLVDLSKFIDRKIKVWGQTQKAQKVGWLMDVGKVEVYD